MTPISKSTFVLGHRHLLGIEGLSAADISGLLDLSEEYVELNRQVDKKRTSLRGRTQINLFFEASTRTQSSFEIAGKRLGADVMNMSVTSSSMRKGETLIDTAVTLNAMHPDILVVRHHASGAVELLARKVDGSVINAGDGAHEHPTQALLDALTIRRNKGRLEGLVIAICGDVMHSRVARSNILLLNIMGARVRVVAPSTLLPRGIERMGVEVARDMRAFVGEPGASHRETFASASQAAATGGITTIICQPDTSPVIDNSATVDFVLRRARDTAIVNIHPMAALTKGLLGLEMTEIGLLKAAGAVAFTDGDKSVTNAQVMRRALTYARDFDALIVHHTEDPDLVGEGVMNEGEFAARLGLVGIPTAAEAVMLERDMRLVALTGGRYHAASLSCIESLEILKRARDAGLAVSASFSF